MNCEGRKGFLTLSNCENPGLTPCANCGRTMCTAHLAPQSGFTTCLDCAAANPQYKQEGEYDDTWAAGYRRSYYDDTGYEPVHGFSRYDRVGFTSRTRNLSEDEPERDGFDAS
ncbi:MAG TPA: hypothetical protein VND45_01510 [Thermoanaerobaculia bacterium]|jgi:hypothetical protein|nr:hypothetical protein [Thermoanaerobaculia bacterium]